MDKIKKIMYDFDIKIQKNPSKALIGMFVAFCLVIIIIILSIIVRTLLNVLKVDDPYKIIAISGLISSFGLQCLINIFSSIGLIPTKGMTLPFVSYGGSSMISVALLFGFLLSLTNKKNENLWIKNTY